MRIDLHTHSTASDGTVPPDQLPFAAREAGLDVIALTDHDTIVGIDAASRAADAAGITLVSGVELSCVLGTSEVHLLGYLFDPSHAGLTAELATIRDDRTRRAERMVRRCRALGADITWERVLHIADGAPVGRPHVAVALTEAHLVPRYADAFTDEWLGDGGRAHVPKHVLTVQRAIATIRDAGGVTVLAHPRSSRRSGTVSDEQLVALAGHGLHGIEVDHPEHSARTRAQLRDLAARAGLLATGASDFHGSRKAARLGECTTDPTILEELTAWTRHR